MARRKGTELSVFKGREAKLNRAIFQALALKGPQTIYDIHKQVKTQRGLKQTKYASVNKRIRLLEESGYVRRVGVKKTKAGFEATIFELAIRGYLAIVLNSMSPESLMKKLNEATALSFLATILEGE